MPLMMPELAREKVLLRPLTSEIIYRGLEPPREAQLRPTA